MILYLDTSALVKLYVREAGSDAVRAAVLNVDQVSTSGVAYPEARAAFARRAREGAFSQHTLRSLVRDLDDEWRALVVVPCNEAITHLAGDLAERHALRGFDAIHLASAMTLGELVGEPPRFLCFDDRLTQAAGAERLAAPPESSASGK